MKQSFLTCNRTLVWHTIFMIRAKRSSPRTGPASFKRAKLSTKSSTVRASAVTRKELKRAATAIVPVSTTLNNGGTFFVYPRIAAGDDDDEREGRTVKLKGIQLVGTVQGEAGNQVLVRAITFLWKQALVNPVVGEILEFTGSPAFYGTYNVSHANNYEILRDDIINVAEVGQLTKHYHLQKNINVVQNYFGPALTEQSDKDIWIFLVTNTGNALCTAQAATTFVDM